MKLRPHVRKVAGTGAHRELSAERTLERMRPHLRHMGVTRIADITGLVTTDMVARMFPATPGANIAANLPFVLGLPPQEHDDA